VAATADHGYRVRSKGQYPFIDGIMHVELLPAQAAHELTAADRNYQTPYIGVTTDGHPLAGLYSLMDTGISGTAAAEAASVYLDTLRPHYRTAAVLPIDSPIWRRWTNAFPAWVPKGVQLGRMSEAERNSAFDVMAASLSGEGFAAVRNAMRMNGALGEIVDDYRETLREFTYWMTIFGDPSGWSAGEPWGWQLMGHHVDVNCVFVGSQLVLAPVFLGAEPTSATHGAYAGTRIFDNETEHGLALRRSLTGQQVAVAELGSSILSADLPAELAGPYNGRHLTGAGADNVVIPYEGIIATELSSGQRELMLTLIDEFVNRLPSRHAELKRVQVRSHLDETRFAWRGRHDDSGAFYYRVHSPVVIIEYDNHPGIFLDYDEPERFHVHTIIREPNGNDYGKELLAQHYAGFHSAVPRTADSLAGLGH
jgi:Protein of unknown function (DUF3500)